MVKIEYGWLKCYCPLRVENNVRTFCPHCCLWWCDNLSLHGPDLCCWPLTRTNLLLDSTLVWISYWRAPWGDDRRKFMPITNNWASMHTHASLNNPRWEARTFWYQLVPTALSCSTQVLMKFGYAINVCVRVRVFCARVRSKGLFWVAMMKGLKLEVWREEKCCLCCVIITHPLTWWGQFVFRDGFQWPLFVPTEIQLLGSWIFDGAFGLCFKKYLLMKVLRISFNTVFLFYHEGKNV